MKDPQSIGSGWGTDERPFRELLGASLTVDTGAVFLSSSVRPLNVAYAMVSSAWIVLGRDDVEPLNKFNRRGNQFSADGFTLSGAFGSRLRARGIDQIDRVVELLGRDPSTRRAVAFIGGPDDLDRNDRDFPCASLVQFFLRAGRVHASVYMRSQSLLGVFPYDLVNFRLLLEYVSWRVGEATGKLHFAFGSLHIYEEEVRIAMEFLSEEGAAFTEPPVRFRWDNVTETYSRWIASGVVADDPLST